MNKEAPTLNVADRRRRRSRKERKKERESPFLLDLFVSRRKVREKDAEKELEVKAWKERHSTCLLWAYRTYTYQFVLVQYRDARVYGFNPALY